MKKTELKALIKECIVEESKLVQEATEIDFSELAEDKQAFVETHGVNKDVFDEVSPNVYFFDGIHGTTSTSDAPNMKRYTKKDLQKLIDDDKFRWLELSTIGF
jgi:hypothetical protein